MTDYSNTLNGSCDVTWHTSRGPSLRAVWFRPSLLEIA